MNNGTFKVGEIAIVCGANWHPENIGKECEIVRPLGIYLFRCARRGDFNAPLHEDWRYVVSIDGVEFAVEPRHLRKRRPPQDWVKLCNLTDIPREVVHG